MVDKELRERLDLLTRLGLAILRNLYTGEAQRNTAALNTADAIHDLWEGIEAKWAKRLKE